jgi:hypothetical protein
MSSERLFHVSEQSGLRRFEPRSHASGRALVWAIAESRLHNYLLPRDCPRVTYYACSSTTAVDRATFFSASTSESVVAIEKGWLGAVCSTPLYVYELPSERFVLHDAIAGYFVSAETVQPIAQLCVPRPLDALLARPVELRLLSSLVPLRDAVVRSSLGFSIIRFANARLQ